MLYILWCCDFGLNELGESYQFLSVFLLISLLKRHRWPSLHLSPSLHLPHLVTVFHSFTMPLFTPTCWGCQCVNVYIRKFCIAILVCSLYFINCFCCKCSQKRRLKDLYMIFTDYNKPSNKKPAWSFKEERHKSFAWSFWYFLPFDVS